MSKKILALVLAVVLCLSLVACGSQAAPEATATPEATAAPAAEATATPEANMANPVNTVADFAALQAAQPTILMNDAPQGATNVTYSWISNIPVIAQITFTLNGANYTYRAAVCGSQAPTVDISGVYSLDNMAATTQTIGGENEVTGSYIIRYNGSTGEGVATWNTTNTQCQYSLYTDTGCTGSMPILDVMKTLFTYTADAATVSGVVLEAENSILVVTLDNDTTVTFETVGMVCTVKANDKVDVLYRGSLTGSAQALKVTKTGSVETSSVKGTITYVSEDGTQMNLVTADNNIYLFDIASAQITGIVTVVTENLKVNVTYTGDLHDVTNLPVAKTVETLEIIPDPTATPTAAPTFVNRSQTGICTSWDNVGSWIYVTVNGIQFVAKDGATVTGTPAAGVTVTVSYRDYGNYNYTVTGVAFGSATPTPAPSYTDATVSGTVDYANGIWIGVNGMDFTVNSANCYVSGTAEVGGWATINYRDYGYGVYEVTSAYFSSANYSVSGTVNDFNQRGNNITVDGVEYYFTNSTTYNQTPEAGMHAEMIVNGSNEVISGTFTGLLVEQPAPAADRETVCGVVDDFNEHGSNITIGGVEYYFTNSSSYNQVPSVGMNAVLVVNSSNEILEATFS